MRGSTGTSEDESAPHPYLISGFGALSTAVFVGWSRWLGSPDDAASVVVGVVSIAVPALALVWAGFRLARSDIGAARYGRIGRWCFGGGAAFLAINAFVMAFFPRGDLTGNVAWAHFALNAGAAIGVLVGAVEARAIQREVAATTDTVRAEQLEADRELLAYLNDLLRHEVLNSTQIINGHASLLLEDADGARRDRLETIDRESEALTGVIDDVRAMLDATQTSEYRAVVDLGDVVADELARLERRFDDVTVEATVPDGLYVEGNEGMRWLFANLLENAVEHNDGDGPRVEVTVSETSETVTVRIADDGPGIPPDVRETLFDRRSDNHGLGLYLVRILATRYGGSVDLAETGPDGTAFTVTLPRADEPSDPSHRRADPDSSPIDARVPAGTEPGSDGESGIGADGGSKTDTDSGSEIGAGSESEANTGTETGTGSDDPSIGSS